MGVRDNLVKNQNNRVFYLEPNDVYEATDAALSEHSMVPYEDLCISINLTCEVYDRRGTKIEKGSYVLAIEADKVKNQNFLQGMGKHNSEFTLAGDDVSTYLTTYYTDLSSNDPAQRQLIEGLGIESINISYENYYAPRIQIKFIDVRGEALFGMEENIHNEAGKITGENVFGAFFTIPYPKFRLQVKGFYGRPVTFQLACESFKGNFNASNGNFEANVTFIGYQYSLMTDIPMRYLIAAPLQEYYGVEYWDKNKESERWRLSDGTSPITLFEFANIVNTANMDKDDKRGGLSPQEEAKLEQLQTFKAEYENLSYAYNNFVKSLKNSDGNGGSVGYYISDNAADKQQVLLMYSAGEKNEARGSTNNFSIGFGPVQQTPQSPNEIIVNFSESVTSAYNSLTKSLLEYNKSVNTGDFKSRISESNFVNGRSEAWDGVKSMVAIRCLETVTDSDGNTTVYLCNNNYVNSEYHAGLEVLDNDFPVNGTVLEKSIAAQVKSNLQNKESTNIGDYWLVIDLKELEHEINKGIALCKQEIDSITNSPSEKNEVDYTQVLPFKPTIGNIFKMVMCHLETLCHVLFATGNQIDSKHRTPSSTGIGPDKTDFATINPKEEVTYGPFPGVLNRGTSSTENGDAEKDDDYVRAWVGDIVNANGEHPFEDEANLVRGFIRATQCVREEIDRQPDYIISGKRELSNIPILPFDEMDGYNEFIPIGNTNNENSYISALAGQLGFRIANIFGITNGGRTLGNDATLYGELDALNYYMSLKDIEKLSQYIIGNSGDNLATRLENIMLCNNEGQEYASVSLSGNGVKKHAFETNLVSDEYSQTNRHPMYRKNGGSFEYCHYYDKNKTSLVPSYLASDFSYYSSPAVGSKSIRFKCVDEPDGKKHDVYFEPYAEPVVNSDYYDGYNFLYADSDFPSVQEAEGIQNSKYINTSMFDIVMPDAEGVGDKISEYKRMLEETSVEAYDYTADITKYRYLYRRHWRMDRETYNSMFKNKGTEMYCENLSSEIRSKSKGNGPKGSEDMLLFITQNIKDKHCNVSVFDKELNRDPYTKKFIHELNVNAHNNTCESIFAHEIYYLQNEQNNTARRNRSKFLLLLHSLKYERPNSNNWWFRNKNKKNGTIEMLPLGQILLLGGLLWRQREETDPIITENDRLKYHNINKDNTLFNKDGVFFISEKSGESYMSISEYFGIDIETLDLRYQNRLVKFFTDFVDNNFESNFSIFEIRSNRNSTLSANEWKDIKTLLSTKRYVGEIINLLREKTNICKSGNTFTYDGIVDRYMGFVCRDNRMRLYINDDSEHSYLQDILRKLYAYEVFAYDCLGKYTEQTDKEHTMIKISESDYRSYLKGFADTLKKICDEKTKVIPSQNNDTELTLNPESFSKEMAIDIYYYLKNLWDKWLVVHHREGESPTGQEYFNVEHFFKKNFIFVDKFYVNTYDLLPCNPEEVTKAITDIFSNRDATLYSFLSQICSVHGCMMFAMPDFINFGRNIEEGCNALIDAFTAYPYENVGKPREENKFVVMYADRPSDTVTDKTGYRTDSFDIKPTENGQTLPAAFKSVRLRPDNADEDYDPDDNMKVHGYGVPAFGVSFGRQKQSLFKNINVNMNNPMTTSVSIQATTEIANMGKDTGRKVFFQGQDIFSIYSNYSYECEVEMMGNAQIMPLMYFQLLNIPLWRGAYMIFKVNHTITPGNMVTHFVGQKMSKISTPWCTRSVVKAKDSAGINGDVDNGPVDTTQRNKEYMPPISSEYEPKETVYEPHMDESTYDSLIPCSGYSDYPNKPPQPSQEYIDALKENIYTENCSLVLDGYALRCELAKMYLAIRDEYEAACNRQYTICVTSAVRGKSSGSYSEYSEHNGPDSQRKYHSNAIDLNIADIKTHKQNGKKYIEIFRLMDIVINNHFNDIGQLILESKKGDYNTCFTDGRGMYKDSEMGYNCLHLSCGNKTTASKYKGNKEHPEIYVSRGDYSSYKFRSVEDAANNCAPEFLAIAGKFYWKIGYDTFHTCFNNFNRMDEIMLNKLFKPYKSNSESAKSMFDISKKASDYKVDDSVVFREVIKYLGLPFANNNGQVIRDTKTKYPVLDDSGRAKFADDSRGMDGKALVTNVAMDMNLNPCPSFSIESCREAYATKVSSYSDLKAGDIIFVNKNDVVIFLGNGRVAGSDNKGVAIFQLSDNPKYEYRRHSSMDVPSPTGSDVESRIWRMLTEELHYTPEGAAGFMGNIYAESEMKPNKVNSRYKGGDAQYTANADETMTKDEFIKDGYAYGLCQWLGARKGSLWEHTKDKGESVADVDGQLALIKKELKDVYYGNLLKNLTSTKSIYDSAIRVMVKYEAPTYSECNASFGKRYEAAKGYYNQFMREEKTDDPQNLYYVQNGDYAKLVEQ